MNWKARVGFFLLTTGIFMVGSAIIYAASGSDQWISRLAVGILSLGFVYSGMSK
jgi:hypothetical protein